MDKIQKIDKILINTDSTASIYNSLNPKTKLYFLINKYLKIVMQKTGAQSFEFRHVKAHTNKNDKRSWVNEWCDTKAKECMRNKRKRIQNQK